MKYLFALDNSVAALREKTDVDCGFKGWAVYEEELKKTMAAVITVTDRQTGSEHQTVAVHIFVEGNVLIWVEPGHLDPYGSPMPRVHRFELAAPIEKARHNVYFCVAKRDYDFKIKVDQEYECDMAWYTARLAEIGVSFSEMRAGLREELTGPDA